MARSYGNSVFRFFEELFPAVTAPNYICTNSVGGFPFLHTLASVLLLVDFFGDDHSDQCEVILHCSFDLYFSNN